VLSNSVFIQEALKRITFVLIVAERLKETAKIYQLEI